MARKTTEPTQAMRRYIREWYNDKIKIDPAILALKLKIDKINLINIMNDMGIRNKREHHYDN